MGIIERIKCGNGNCYLISENNNSILIDTCRTKYSGTILEACKNKNVKLIILTHGHVDHIQNAAFLSNELNVPIAMHKADCELIKNNMLEPLFAKNILGKLILALSIKSFKEDNIEPFESMMFLKEGDTLEEYGINATVIELPGHTKGSIGIKAFGTDLIVGDALMNMIYPTISMLYGNLEQVKKSANKISGINNVTIHFGHGDPVDNKKRWI